MKFLASVLVLASSVLALPDPSKASTSLARRASDTQITDQYLFDISLPAFTTKRNAKDPASLDWSSDGCSKSPDNPFGFPFIPACHRHDFGYRNYKAAGTFDANKSRLDDAFYADLKRVCATYSGLKKTSCDSTAWTYYQAVKVFGSSAAVDGSKAV